ncbi:MAG: hypothetical protein ACR2QJ_08245 [Geminicoccaceae bacterium]
MSSSSTKLSGKRGAETILEKKPPEDFAIYGLEAAERSDDPCYLKVKYRDVDGSETTTQEFKECAGRKDGKGTTKSHRTVSLPDFMWAVGARVCMNKGKIKGIQLIGEYEECLLGAETVSVPAPCSRQFKQNGSDQGIACPDPEDRRHVERICGNTSLYRGAYFARPNCPGHKLTVPDEDWAKEVLCPAGQVATGVQLSTADGGGDRKLINGLGLRCRTIEEFESRKIITRSN